MVLQEPRHGAFALGRLRGPQLALELRDRSVLELGGAPEVGVALSALEVGPRLVGQEPIGDVAMAEGGGRDQRGILDLDVVVDLVALLEAAQDRDRVLDRRLADEYRLEAALERRVLLDVLAVLVERGRADSAQLAPRERRLEHVRRVDRALGPARADEGVQLVAEEDHPALGLLDLLYHGL